MSDKLLQNEIDTLENKIKDLKELRDMFEKFEDEDSALAAGVLITEDEYFRRLELKENPINVIIKMNNGSYVPIFTFV